MNSVTLPMGSISVIDKIEKDIGLISGIFGNSGGVVQGLRRDCKTLP